MNDNKNEQEPCKRMPYSFLETQKKLTAWMLEEFGNPREMDTAESDKWHERNGVINHFLRSIFLDT